MRVEIRDVISVKSFAARWPNAAGPLCLFIRSCYQEQADNLLSLFRDGAETSSREHKTPVHRYRSCRRRGWTAVGAFEEILDRVRMLSSTCDRIASIAKRSMLALEHSRLSSAASPFRKPVDIALR
jgi:hypothetical protein